MKYSTDRRPSAARYLLILTCTACVLLGATARAGEIAGFELESLDDGYRLQTQGLVDAPPDRVWQVLTDYTALHRVSPRIVESGKATRLDIDFSFAMDSYSWVPSFVSRFVASAALKADAEELIAGIERTVRAQDGQSDER